MLALSTARSGTASSAPAKVSILDPAIRLLAERVHAHNTTSEDPRLRLSVHAGEVHRHGRGWAGAARHHYRDIDPGSYAQVSRPGRTTAA